MLPHQLQTSIGNLNFQLFDKNQNPITQSHTIAIGAVRPNLPNGMTVQNTQGVLLNFTPQNDMQNIQFCCWWDVALETLQNLGSGSGESLETFSWQKNKSIVTIGTEDYESLAVRLPHCQFSEKNPPVFLQNKGICIEVPFVQKNSLLSLHYIVSENRFPEPVASSTWFAVDINHQDVQKQLI